MANAPFASRWVILRVLAGLLVVCGATTGPLLAQGNPFLRGDSNGDGEIDLSDGINTLNFLFLGGKEPPCFDAVDANDDGDMDISDASFVLSYLFTGGDAPPAPGPNVPGVDPTADPIGCGPVAPPSDPRTFEPPESYRNTPAAPSRPPNPYLSSRGPVAGMHLFSGEAYVQAVDLAPNLRLKSVCTANPTTTRHWRGRGSNGGMPNRISMNRTFVEPVGNGWDLSTNIHLFADGEDMLLFNGDHRFDRFEKQPSGIFTAPGVAAHATFEGQLFTMFFHSGGKWIFDLALVTRKEGEGNPWLGDISVIEDPAGNEVTFTYDASGRLTRVEDGGRHTPFHNAFMAYSYNADGRIATVTDHAGRQVKYSYYAEGEAGGSPGDLKSVTTPAVTGTSNKNDYPDGKTVTFTYTTGFADEELNHNLLSITDATGNTFLRLEYSKGTDPSSLDYDRVTKRTHGSDNDGNNENWDFFSYAPQTPSAENGGATLKTIVSGSSGEVREYLYDARNLLVEAREFTGRCDPKFPATETTNRPQGKLRAGDPDVFVTRYRWNDDQLPVSIQTPEGDLTTIVYLPPGAPNGSPSVQYNPKEISLLIRRGGQELKTIRSFEYDPATNALVRAVDALGRETLCEYDARGNLTAIHLPPICNLVAELSYSEFGQLVEHVHPPMADGRRRRDRFEYYGPDDGHQAGFLKRVVSIGASQNPVEPPVEVETTFEYDQAGNLSSRRDVRGTVAWRHNQRGQVVQEQATYLVDGKESLVTLRELYYDANDLLVREDVANLDVNGRSIPENSFWSRMRGYDKLHRLTRLHQEVRVAQIEPGKLEIPNLVASAFETTEYLYDVAGRLARVRYPDAVDGTDPDHTLDFRYDERGLVYERTKAGNRASIASTSRHSYNGNGDPTEILEGLPGDPRRTLFEYGVLDRERRVRVIDAHENSAEKRFDAEGRLVAIAHHGRLLDGADRPVEEKPLLLARKSFTYDDLDRLIAEETDHFHHRDFNVTGRPTPVGEEGKSTHRFTWSEASQLLSATDDNGNVTRYEYDGLGRLSKSTDAAGNEQLFSYDAVSSLASVLTRDASASADGTTTFEELTTSFTYDPLGRRTKVSDSTGRSSSCVYDARGFVLEARDALGNVTRSVGDGACRAKVRSRSMTEDGTGGTPVVGTITHTFDYDSAGRLFSVTDSNKNVTRYTYDPLDRLATISNADGTRGQFRYDRLDNLIETQDPNGTLVKMTYDILGRRIRREFTAGLIPAVATSPDTFRYDSLSRMVRAENQNADTIFEYDSLDNVVRETQNGRVVEADYDGESNLRRLVYPDTSEVLYEPDTLGRVASVTEGGAQLAAFAYAGPDRVRQALYRGTFGTQVRFDAARRIEQVTHGIPGDRPTILERHVYQHNQTDLEFIRARQVSGITHRFVWDSASRIVGSTSEGPPGSPPVAMDLRLDGEGNRLQVFGGLDPGDYFRDPTLPLPGDFQMNRYTKTPFDQRQYDRNGALLESSSATGKKGYDYYATGQLAHSVQEPLVHTYRYDALGREISRTSEIPGQPPVEERTIYAGASVLGRSTGTVTQKFFYGGGGSGGRIAVRVTPADGTGSVDLFPLDDGKGQVATLVDAKGTVLERYDLNAFGVLRVFDAQGAQIPASRFGYDQLDGELRWDSATGLVHDPLSGELYDPRSDARISTNMTIERQTPKRDFGDRMKAGLETAGGLLANGAARMSGLRGHRDVGGYRSSLSMPLSAGPSGSTAKVMFNPREYTITKSTPWKHHDIQGHDAPTLEFTSGEPYRTQFELFFDGYEERRDLAHGGNCGEHARWKSFRGGGLRLHSQCASRGASIVGGMLPGGAILSSALSSRGPRQSTSLDGSFSHKSSPELHTAAHEAAHVVQQRGGVHLRTSGLGDSTDDEMCFSSLRYHYWMWSNASGNSLRYHEWRWPDATGKSVRKNITVNLFKSDKSPGRGYNLFECFPTQWSSVNFDTSSTVQTETLTVKLGRIEFKT